MKSIFLDALGIIQYEYYLFKVFFPSSLPSPKKYGYSTHSPKCCHPEHTTVDTGNTTVLLLVFFFYLSVKRSIKEREEMRGLTIVFQRCREV